MGPLGICPGPSGEPTSVVLLVSSLSAFHFHLLPVGPTLFVQKVGASKYRFCLIILGIFFYALVEELVEIV